MAWKSDEFNLKVSLVIPTYEPNFENNHKSQILWKFYEKNFRSWLHPKGVSSRLEIRLLIVDYKSSVDFQRLLRQFAARNNEIDLLLGDRKLSSTQALNQVWNCDADSVLTSHRIAQPSIMIGWSLSMLNLSKPHCFSDFYNLFDWGLRNFDQLQTRAIDKPGKNFISRGITCSECCFFSSWFNKKFEHQIGDVLVNDLGFSLFWMAEAIDTHRLLSYRVFVDHDHFVDRGRHNRIVLKNTFSQDHSSMRNIARSLFIPRGYFPKPWPGLSLSNIFHETLQPIKDRSSVPALAIYGYRFSRILAGRFWKLCPVCSPANLISWLF